MDEVTGLPDARARAAWLWLDNMLLEIWERIAEDASSKRPADGAHDRLQRLHARGRNIEAERARLSALGVNFRARSSPRRRDAAVRTRPGNLFGLFELSSAEVRVLATRRQIEWE